MDPVGPSFVHVPVNKILSQENADQVFVFHTNMGNGLMDEFGIAHRQGTFDVFINGGSRQPGCPLFTEGYLHDKMFSTNNRRNRNKPRVTYPRDVTSFYTRYDRTSKSSELDSQLRERVFDVTNGLINTAKTLISPVAAFKNALHNYQKVNNACVKLKHIFIIVQEYI